MRHSELAHLNPNCSLALALDEVGEWWTLLIIREAFLGTVRFEDFRSRLGIARNVLTVRLDKLVERTILERRMSAGHRGRSDYVLTPKGADLLTSLAALMQWSDRWIAPERGAPVVFVDAKTSNPLAELVLRTRAGKRCWPSDVAFQAGPGATPRTRARFQALRKPQ